MPSPRAFRRSIYLAPAIVGALFLFGASPAVAAPPSDADLLRASSVVIDARVARLTPHWNADHSLIFTTVELDVLETIASRGSSPATRYSLEVLGGEVGGVGLVISEAPRFIAGERAIVFVKHWGADRLTVTGGAEGLLHIDQTGQVGGRSIGAAQYAARIRALAK